MSGAADSLAPPPAAAGKLTRLVLKIPDLTKRRLKARAASLGISVYGDHTQEERTMGKKNVHSWLSDG